MEGFWRYRISIISEGVNHEKVLYLVERMDTHIITLLTTYQLPAIFFGAFFFGETIIITAAFLAGQGIWSIYTVFILAFLGTIISDSLWFLFGQSILHFLTRWKRGRKKVTELEKQEVPLKKHTPFFVLLFIKFLYGTRILTIIYLSSRKLNFLLFLFFDAIGTVLWLIVMIVIGWGISHGTYQWSPTLQRTEYVLSFLALALIGTHFLIVWISKKIPKK